MKPSGQFQHTSLKSRDFEATTVVLVSFFGALALLSLVVALHELGHFLAMKACGIPVATFSVGMGPVLWSKRIGETNYQLAALPIGGFVRPFTPEELKEQPNGASTGGRPSFDDAAPRKRFIVAAAGPAMNIVLALLVAFLFLTPSENLPQNGPVKVTNVLEGSRAEGAGLKEGDVILSVNNTEISTIDRAAIALRSTALYGKADIIVSRNGEKLRLHGEVPRWEGKGALPSFGVTIITAQVIENPSVLDRVSFAADQVLMMFSVQLEFLTGLFQGERSVREMSGPVGIVSHLSDRVNTGLIQGIQVSWLTLVSLFFFLNVGLAFMNLLPIPVLDGGHMLLATVEGIARRPLHPRIRFGVQIAGVALLLCLFGTTLVNDILRLTS